MCLSTSRYFTIENDGMVILVISVRLSTNEKQPVYMKPSTESTQNQIADTSDRCIEEQAVIDKVLAHLIKKRGVAASTRIATGCAGLARLGLVGIDPDFTSTFTTSRNPETGGRAAYCLIKAGRGETERKAADSAQNSAGATIKWSGREMIQAHPVTDFLLGRQGCRVYSPYTLTANRQQEAPVLKIRPVFLAISRWLRPGQ